MVLCIKYFINNIKVGHSTLKKFELITHNYCEFSFGLGALSRIIHILVANLSTVDDRKYKMSRIVIGKISLMKENA